MSKNEVFLVTGATGHTGKGTVKLLLESGVRVRAAVHKLDSRSEALANLGAEVIAGDLLDYNFVSEIVDGVKAAYFIYPITPGLIQATAYFAIAAARAGVSAIVNMSQKSARVEANSHAAQDHWVAERLFDNSGVPVTHIRPTLFAEWFLYRSPMVKAGLVKFPISKGAHAPIAAHDQSRLITAILLNPAEHAGKTYPLYGPKQMTHVELTKAIGGVLGRDVNYQPVTFEAWEKVAADAGRPLTPFLAQHLREISRDFENGIFEGTDEVIERVTGKAPITIEEWTQQHRQAFE